MTAQVEAAAEVIEQLSCEETRLTLRCLSVCPQDQRPTAAMEETLTCRRSPFSQVFGRQGQLMQASECRCQSLQDFLQEN